MLEDKFTDVILIAGDKKKVIKCHKLILISSSTYFEELFELIESNDDNCCKYTTIVLREINHECLLKVLEYVYCGKVDLNANENDEFTRAANYLNIKITNLTKNSGDQFDVTLLTQMSQETVIDEITHDFTMNSTLCGNESDEEESRDIQLSKNKQIEPKLKKRKLEASSYICQFCFRHCDYPIHQNYCFLNKNRMSLECGSCLKDFEFVTSFREHTATYHGNNLN